MSVIKFNLNNEIRRITVQKQPTYEEVSEILKRLYGAKLAEVDFALRYLDSEGDVVTVSSTEELEEAFRNFADKPIARFSVFTIEKEEEDDDDEDDEEPSEEDARNLFAALLGLPRQQTKPTCPLFAQNRCGPKLACPLFAQRGPCLRPQPTPQPAAKEEKVVHRAFCDHCDARIVGLRFKCSNCPDFDLCEKCFPAKNEKHDASHIFVKIAYPSQYVCIRRAPKQETAKTEEAKPTSIPIKVTVPEEKTEEVKTEPEAPKEVNALVELAKEAETVAKEAETVPEPEVVDVTEEKKKEISPFEAKLVQLEEMGFADRERNIQTLVNRSGDLVKTIRDLLA